MKKNSRKKAQNMQNGPQITQMDAYYKKQEKRYKTGKNGSGLHS